MNKPLKLSRFFSRGKVFNPCLGQCVGNVGPDIFDHLVPYVTAEIKSLPRIAAAHQTTDLHSLLLEISDLEHIDLAIPERMASQQGRQLLAQLLYRYCKVSIDEYRPQYFSSCTGPVLE